MNTELIDYTKCREYARSLCGSCGIPECDVADIGSDAFLLSIRRAWRADDSAENPEAVANRLMYTSVVDVIRRRNTRANKTIREADDISATGEHDGEPTDDEKSDTGLVISDNGNDIKAIEEIAWENPFWLRLFENERRKLKGSCRKAVRLLLQDSRLPIARARLGVSRPTFSTIVKKLCERFDLCFQALRAWRRQN